MAQTIRYFDATGAGTADGTSWANRAQFYNAGAYSSVITGHNFTSGSSLLCYINGNHTVTSTLVSGTFTSGAPSAARNMIWHGCDSSGNPLTPPDPDWISPLEPWDDSALPNITLNVAGTYKIQLSFHHFRLIKLTAGYNDAGYCYWNPQSWADWISVVCSTGLGRGIIPGFNNGGLTNSLIKTTASAAILVYCDQYVVMRNCRIWSSGASSCDAGIFARIGNIVNCTLYGLPGDGIQTNGSESYLYNNTIVGCSGDGIQLGNGPGHLCIQNMITGNGGYAINGGSFNYTRNVLRNRMRHNTSGSGSGTWSAEYTALENNESTTGSEATDDAIEYVNRAIGDLRIKNTAGIWDKGFGAGRQDPSGSGGGLLRHPAMQGGMNG